MIFDVIFYQLYRFYAWQPDWTPHETTIWSVGVSWGVLVFFPLNWLWIILFSGNMWSGYAYVSSWVIGWGTSYLCFGRRGRWCDIVKRKPLIRNSKKWSVVIAIIYMTIVIGFFILGIFISEYMEDYVESKRSFEDMIEQLNR